MYSIRLDPFPIGHGCERLSMEPTKCILNGKTCTLVSLAYCKFYNMIETPDPLNCGCPSWNCEAVRYSPNE